MDVHSYHSAIRVLWFSGFDFPAIPDAFFFNRGVVFDDGFMPGTGVIREENEVADLSSFE